MTTSDERFASEVGAARVFVALAGLFGALGVGLGAYGAHGLESALSGQPDVALRLEWWGTASLYHLTHALGVGLVGSIAGRLHRGAAMAAGTLFVIGVLLFAGTLYAMALGAPRWLGAITPLGGLALIAGWVAVAVAALRKPRGARGR